jgi:hypothetical protein
MKQNCKWCGSAFNTRPSLVRIGKGKFCSKKCYNLWRRGKKARNPRYKNLEPKILRKLYWDEGLTIKEVAKRLSCCSDTVLAYMKACSIPRRKPGLRMTSDVKRHLSSVKLRVRRATSIPISKIISEDLLINYVLKNPKEFGYKDVYLYETSSYDLIGMKENGEIERIEVEVTAKNFLKHKKAEADRIISYHGTSKELPLPLTVLNKERFIPFAEKIFQLANGNPS